MNATETPPTRLNIHLASKTGRALIAVTERDGHSRTEAANRAIQLYERLTAHTAQGGAVILRDRNGHDIELTLL